MIPATLALSHACFYLCTLVGSCGVYLLLWLGFLSKLCNLSPLSDLGHVHLIHAPPFLILFFFKLHALVPKSVSTGKFVA